MPEAAVAEYTPNRPHLKRFMEIMQLIPIHQMENGEMKIGFIDPVLTMAGRAVELYGEIGKKAEDSESVAYHDEIVGTFARAVDPKTRAEDRNSTQIDEDERLALRADLAVTQRHIEASLANPYFTIGPVLLGATVLGCLAYRPTEFAEQFETKGRKIVRRQLGDGYHPRFRGYYNLLRRYSSGQISIHDYEGLRAFATLTPELYQIRFEDYVNTVFGPDVAPAQQTKNMKLARKLGIITAASSFLDLVNKPMDIVDATLDEAADYFFEAYSPGKESEDKRKLEVRLSEERKVHILRGDRNGGGHVLKLLDPRFHRIVSDKKYLHASADPKTGVCYGIVENNLTGEPKLSVFFPSRWGEAEVIAAIERPDELLYERKGKDDGRPVVEQLVRGGGVLIIRVLDAQNRKVIAAYPALCRQEGAPLPKNDNITRRFMRMVRRDEQERAAELTRR